MRQWRGQDGRCRGVCTGPVVETQKRGNKMGGGLSGVEALLKCFSIDGAHIQETWVGAAEKVLLGFSGGPAAAASGSGPEITPVHVSAY